ncbi:EcsC family protein [Microbacterium xylanilyticum]
MTALSDYEHEAWQRLQAFHARPLTRVGQEAGEKVADGAAFVGEKAKGFVDNHPRAQAAIETARKGGAAARKGAAAVAELVPDEATAWVGVALQSAQKTAAKLSRAGLSPSQMVKRHRKRGHDVHRLSDLRTLDLQEVDAVRGRGLSWYYPAAAALSGIGAGLVISGGELVVVASAGAGAAPSGLAVAGAIAGDTALVLAIGSRAIGDIALRYGYDPEDPAEKAFMLTAVNLGTAMSTSAKSAALADISRLTQALVRGKSWEVLNKHVVANVASKIWPRLGTRLTKQGLGKIVPAAGILIAGSINWATLESIVDAADLAYRRRFLLDKYPHLAADGPVELIVDETPTATDDEPISVVDALRDEAGVGEEG